MLGGFKTNAKTGDLQQEKLVLDLMHAQREQLATLAEEEKSLGALQKKNQQTLLDIGRRRAALEKAERKLAGRTKAAQRSLADQKAALEAQSRRLDAQSKAAQAHEAKCRQTERELAVTTADLQHLRLSLDNQLRAENAPRLKPHAVQTRPACKPKSPPGRRNASLPCRHSPS